MNTVEFLNISSERVGFRREAFIDANVPTEIDNLLFIPIFCDFKHSFIFSSILLNQYKNKVKGSKYVIICSYPGFSQLFKNSDEYWSFSDFKYFKNIYENSQEFDNKSKIYTDIIRGFNENFRNVVNSNFFNNYYYNGFKENYWTDCEKIILNLPMIPSSAVLGKEFLYTLNERSGYKIFIFPSIYLNCWIAGRNSRVQVPKEFYLELINFLKNENIFPVIWNHSFGYDLTNDSSDTQCLFINDHELSRVLSAIRLTGCNLDLFSGTAWLSKIARTPSLIFDERSRFFNTKDNDLFDLTKIETPNKFSFNFVNSIINGSPKSWRDDVFVNIKNNLVNFLPTLDRDTWTTTTEFKKELSFYNLNKTKNKRLGTRFIKILNQ